MVRWYFCLKGRSRIGSVVSWLKSGRGVIGGKVYFFCELVSRDCDDQRKTHRLSLSFVYHVDKNEGQR